MFSRRVPRVYQGCLWGVSLCCLWGVSKVNQSDWKRFNVIQSGPTCLRFALSDLMRLKDFDQSDSKWINVNLKLTSSTNPKTVASQSFWSLLWWQYITISTIPTKSRTSHILSLWTKAMQVNWTLSPGTLLHYATTQKFATMQPLKGQRYLRQCTVLRCQPLEVELKYCNFIRQAEEGGGGGWSEEGEDKEGAFGDTFIHEFYWANRCCFASLFSTVACS